jgi:hypothetical protein
MEEKVAEVVHPADASQPSYAEVIEAAVDASYDVTTDAWGGETFSEKSESGTVAEGSAQAAPGGAEQQVSSEPATVRPTFNLEEDTRNGFDTSDPIYRAALERLAPATTTPDGETVTEPVPAARETEAAAQDEPSITVPALEVTFDGFEVTRLDPSSALAGHEEEIGKIVQDYVRAAVSQVNKQNQEFAEVATLKQTQTFLETAVSELEKGWGAQMRDEALKIMQEHADMARSKPRKFLNLAVRLLGIDPSNPPLQAKPAAGESQAQPATAPSTPQADPKRIARQVVSQQTRPATPVAQTPGQPRKFSSYRDAVADAVSKALEG